MRQNSISQIVKILYKRFAAMKSYSINHTCEVKSLIYNTYITLIVNNILI